MMVFKNLGDVGRIGNVLDPATVDIVAKEIMDLEARHRNLRTGYRPDEHGFLVLFDASGMPSRGELMGIGINRDLSDEFAITVEEVDDFGFLWAITSVVTQECSMRFLLPKSAAWVPPWLAVRIREALGS